ncbi:MAG: TldD/PmbA family protein [Nitriliruptorales bacterium]|nr:TldD/PmbA family protein [Nitriliruptorales bacterium]
MDDLATQALDDAMAAGAEYADVRAVHEDRESLTVQDQRVEGVARATSRGVGVRVLVEGSWGFAGTARLDPAHIAEAARSAVAIARAGASLRRRSIELAPLDVEVDRYVTPHSTDPFDVPVEDKLELLLNATAAANSVDGLAFAKASCDAWRITKWFVSSDGARLNQTLLQVAGGVECVAVDDTQVQARSFPNSFRGYCGTGGWEDIVALDLAGRTPRYAEEAVALLRAPPLPEHTGTVILDGNQVALQVHESVGHPLELDRILGYEAAYAGTSWVAVNDVDRLRYGSELVNLTLDSTTPKALGTYGYDDEGVPAGRHTLVEQGMLRGFLSSRETAPGLGGDVRSNGTMRAESWGAIPLIRMSNIHLEPGEGSLEQLLDDTGNGIFMTTNRSWSIDDKRLNFQFGCEVAYEIRGGRLGRMYRNPTYTGRTPVFWGSCDAIAGAEAWEVYGTPNCGKGQPSQLARVAHGAAPTRFRDVRMGVR